MGKSVVVVGQIQGQVWMRDAQGNLHALHAGMEIPADAVLVKEPGSEVTLQGHENMEFQAPEGQTATLMENAAPAAELGEAAIADAGAQDMASLITALNSGKDIFEDLEATEAVLTGDVGAGGSYVTLANVVESTSAMSLQYAATGIPSAGDNAKLGGSVAGADAPLGGGAVVNPANPPIIYIVPKGDQDKSSAHYSWDEGSYGGAQGEIYITSAEGLEKLTFCGVDIPLDMTDEELPMTLELEHATIIVFGVQPMGGDESNGEYVFGFAFMDNNERRDHSNGPVIDEYEIQVIDKAGNSASDVLQVEIFETILVPNMASLYVMDETTIVEDNEERRAEDDVLIVMTDQSEETMVWVGDGGDLDFSGSELSSHFKNVDVLDLTLEGAAHTISYLGVDDVLDMSGGKNILTILADGDDSIGFDTKDAWTLNAEKSASGDFNVYEGLSQDGELVEVRISKSFEGGLSGLAEPEAVAPNAHVASAPQLSIDMEGQQVLAMQVLDQAKVIIDQG